MQIIDKIHNAIARWLGIPALVETVDAAAKKAADAAFGVLHTNCENRFRQLSTAFAANTAECEARVQNVKTEIDAALEAIEARNNTEISKLREAHNDAVEKAVQAAIDLETRLGAAIATVTSDYQSVDHDLQIKTEALAAAGSKNADSINEVRANLAAFVARLYEAAKIPTSAAVCFYCGFLSTRFEIRGKDAICEKCAVAGR